MVTRLTVYRWLQVIMAAWARAGGLGQKLSMATRAFKLDFIRILVSDLYENWKQTSLGSKQRRSVNAMSVIITGAEI